MLTLAALALLQFSETEPLVRVHVVDAATHAPLLGATVELWTEDETPPLRVETCLARGVTAGADAAVELRWKSGAVAADKARISCAGHASRTVSRSDLDDPIDLYVAESLAGRVLDLDDRPVAGAIVRTRETCRHAVPASATVTAADGSFVLADCPAAEQGADLEVVPHSHVPCGPLDVEWLRAIARRDGSITIHVPAQAPRRCIVVDGAGQPLAHRRIVSVGEIDCAEWTDDHGRCELPPPDADGATELRLRDPWGDEPLHWAVFPRDAEITLRPLSASSSGAGDRGSITLVFPPGIGEHDEWQLELFASDGEVVDSAGKHSLARGPAQLVSGGDFTPWKLSSREIRVGSEPLTLEIVRSPARRVRAALPGTPSCERFAVQAGEVGHALTPGDAPLVELFVPPDAPLTFVAELHDGSVRRVHAAAGAEALEIDLRSASTIVAPAGK